MYTLPPRFLDLFCMQLNQYTCCAAAPRFKMLRLRSSIVWHHWIIDIRNIVFRKNGKVHTPGQTYFACNSLNTHAMHMYLGSKCFIWGPLSTGGRTKLRKNSSSHILTHFNPPSGLVVHVTHSILTLCTCTQVQNVSFEVLYRLISFNYQNYEHCFYVIHIDTSPFHDLFCM